MKKILFTLLLLPLITFAQADKLILGEMVVEYDSVVEKEGLILYYLGDSMVASEHGDLWVAYEDNIDVIEAYDTDDDGKPDTFVTLNSVGEVKEVAGVEADNFMVPDVVEFDELMKEEEEVRRNDGSEAPIVPSENLVDNLDSITIPKYHNYTLYGFFVVLLAGGVWWFKNKRK